ncbi:MAG: ribonuclease III [Lachnospiraceae bacterium]|nr:ribonuclease III [Lachnospiraceae bacterium]
MEEKLIKTYSPVTFAFLGDAVYSLYIREKVVIFANTSPKKLHARTSAYVSASAQAYVADRFLEDEVLSEEELDIYKRGKNAHTATSAKNASQADYHKATGVEALIGWLYLKEEHSRVDELMKLAVKYTDERKKVKL